MRYCALLISSYFYAGNFSFDSLAVQTLRKCRVPDSTVCLIRVPVRNIFVRRQVKLRSVVYSRYRIRVPGYHLKEIYPKLYSCTHTWHNRIGCDCRPFSLWDNKGLRGLQKEKRSDVLTFYHFFNGFLELVKLQFVKLLRKHRTARGLPGRSNR